MFTSEVSENDLFEQVMQSHYQQMELFVFQYGVKPTQIEDVMKTIIIKAFQTIQFYKTEDKVRKSLFQTAIQTLKSYSKLKIIIEDEQQNITDLNGKQLFHFEEDQELHIAISKLEEPIKVVHILYQYHQFSIEDISGLLNSPTSIIREGLIQAKQQLISSLDIVSEEADFDFMYEKRLKIMESAYKRVPLFSKMENVFDALDLEHKVESSSFNEKKSFNKRNVIIAAVLLLCIIASIFLLSQNKLTEDERIINNLEERFENALTAKSKESGIPLSVLNSMSSVVSIRDYFEMLRTASNDQHQIDPIDHEMIEKLYSEFLNSFQLPSKMANSLFNEPLTDDASKSMDFLSTYMEQVQMIQHIFLDTLRVHAEKGQIDLANEIEDTSNYPKEVRDILTLMEKENLILKHHANFNISAPVFEKNEYSENLRASLHDSVSGYVTFLEEETLMPNYSLDEQIALMMTFEETLLQDEVQGHLYHRLMSFQSSLFSELVNSSDRFKIYGKDGSVKQEYRDIWKEIAEIEGNSPLSALMKPIVAEMEQSNWKQSAILNTLSFSNFYNAMYLAKDGKIDGFKYDIYIQEEQYYDVAYDLPDEDFKLTVEALYKDFSANYDREILAMVEPLYIVGLYDYANQHEDPTTMWHLLNKQAFPTPLTEYVANWEQEPSLLSNTDVIRFNTSLILRGKNQEQTVPINFERDGISYEDLWLYYADDYVWEIEYLLIK